MGYTTTYMGERKPEAQKVEKGNPLDSLPLSEDQKTWLRNNTSDTIQKISVGAYGLTKAWLWLKFGPQVLYQVQTIVGRLIPNISLGGTSSPDLGGLESLLQSFPGAESYLRVAAPYLSRLGSTSTTSPVESVLVGAIGVIGTVIIVTEIWKSLKPTLPYAVAGGAEVLGRVGAFIDKRIK